MLSKFLFYWLYIYLEKWKYTYIWRSENTQYEEMQNVSFTLFIENLVSYQPKRPRVAESPQQQRRGRGGISRSLGAFDLLTSRTTHVRNDLSILRSTHRKPSKVTPSDDELYHKCITKVRDNCRKEHIEQSIQEFRNDQGWILFQVVLI